MGWHMKIEFSQKYVELTGELLGKTVLQASLHIADSTVWQGLSSDSEFFPWSHSQEPLLPDLRRTTARPFWNCLLLGQRIGLLTTCYKRCWTPSSGLLSWLQSSVCIVTVWAHCVVPWDTGMGNQGSRAAAPAVCSAMSSTLFSLVHWVTWCIFGTHGAVPNLLACRDTSFRNL